MKKISYNSPVILTYAFICLVFTVLNVVSAGWLNAHILALPGSIFARPSLSPHLITYIFGHAGFSHFAGNTILLLLVGPIAEEKYGSKRLIIMMLSTAILTGVVNSILFKSGLIGASGIVFLLIILSAFTSMKDKKVPLSLILVVICYLGQEIFNGIFANDEVSQFAHIFGGIMGLFWGFFYARRGIPSSSSK